MSEQELKVGDSIIVEGFGYDIVEYFLSQRHIVPQLTEPVYICKVNVPNLLLMPWPEKLVIPFYNPEQPNVEENPNVPVGSVVCPIFNPNHIEDLKALYAMYPVKVRQKTVEFAFSSASVMAQLGKYLTITEVL